MFGNKPLKHFLFGVIFFKSIFSQIPTWILESMGGVFTGFGFYLIAVFPQVEQTEKARSKGCLRNHIVLSLNMISLKVFFFVKNNSYYMTVFGLKNLHHNMRCSSALIYKE